MVDRLADQVAELRTYDPARLPDDSPAALQARQKAEDALYARVRALNAKSLPVADAVTVQMLKETLAADQAVRVCHRELWDIDHIGGWHIRLGAFAQREPVGSPEARETALQQWRAVPHFVDVEISNLETGLRLGYSAPQRIVARVVTQIDGMLAVPPEKSPFMSPARRDSDPQFAAQLQAVISKDVYPALRRYRAFLHDRYEARARSSIGISALPNGPACYRALLRQETTLDVSPEEIFKRGQAMIGANRAAIVAIGRRLYGITDYAAILRRVAHDPANQFKSAAELLQFSKEVMQRARARSMNLFVSPKVPDPQVVPFPEYQRNSGMNPYYSPARNGQPARYLINTENWQGITKGQAEVTTVHEVWPGHHLQVSTAQSLPYRNKFAASANYTAYIEGWARYAERLADEQGMYSTPYARITWRAKPGIGMVVDPGIHAFGWSRERAAAFLKSSGLFNDDRTIQDMIDRITVMPAQLTAYDTGGSEFVELRAQARRRLGKAFDLRSFHEQVLGTGFVPLTVLRELTTAWIDRESGQ